MGSDLIDAAVKAIKIITKPARDLAPAEAFELLMSLVSSGEITLAEEVNSYKAGQQIKVRTSIAGVDYLQALPKNRGSNGSAGAVRTRFFYPTAPFAVVLHRLALRLRDSWGATQIVWGGIGAGSGSHSLDCHMIGTCVDFYGAATRKGNFDVRQDWFLRPMFRKDGKRHPMDPNDNESEQSRRANKSRWSGTAFCGGSNKVVPPQSGHVSNFCHPIGRVMEPMDGFWFHHHRRNGPSCIPRGYIGCRCITTSCWGQSFSSAMREHGNLTRGRYVLDKGVTPVEERTPSTETGHVNPDSHGTFDFFPMPTVGSDISPALTVYFANRKKGHLSTPQNGFPTRALIGALYGVQGPAHSATCSSRLTDPASSGPRGRC
ncbi:MAG TPA: hypothetical protein VE959_22705 [Bryobacteraceae bacterium]|nr:hypothetical protein [Bryobacteraceae bacterium]